MTEITHRELTSSAKTLLFISSILLFLGLATQNYFLLIPSILILSFVLSSFITIIKYRSLHFEVDMRVSKRYVRNRGLIAVLARITNPLEQSFLIKIKIKFSYHYICIDTPETYEIKINAKETISLNWLLLAVHRGNSYVGPVEISPTPLQFLISNKLVAGTKIHVKILPHRPRILVPWKTKRDLLLKMVNQFAQRIKGQGDEFFAVREYQPGDRIKHIHWYASARYDKLFTKEFEDLRNLHFIIYLDLESTMYGPKFDYALSSLVELASLIKGTQHDLAVIAYSDHVERFIVPQVGKNELQLMLNLYDLEAMGSQSNLLEAIKFTQTQRLYNSVAIIFSDLEGNLSEKLKGLHLLQAMNTQVIFVNFSTMHFNILASHDWLLNRTERIEHYELLNEVFPSLVKSEYKKRERELVSILKAVGGDYTIINGYNDNIILALYRLMKRYIPTQRVISEAIERY